MAVDHVLKLYSETIRSSFLHYGFWDNPDNINLETITLQDVKKAQLRYIDHLSSFIPDKVNLILDVGCGIGGNAEYLKNKGYLLEALSPDSFQKSVIKEKFEDNIIFHHCRFENFQPQKQFDLILESESACYIEIDRGLKKAREALKEGGYLLVSDYFVHFQDGSKNLHLKSSHNLDDYLKTSKKYGFELLKEYDQTENTMLTLDYAKYLMDRFVNPAIDYGVYSTKKSFPTIAKMLEKIIKKKWNEKQDQLDLIDSLQFRKYRKYMIYLFQKK
tara:strand:+ start:875 stop:1696 length:822 start_codon:yes stop_codon:yes gene_type:complete